MAKNSDVIKAFINGENQGKASNLYIEKDKLFNYRTVIAERDLTGDKPRFILNKTSYSRSTSTIQNKLELMLLHDNISYSTIDNVRMGASNLKESVNND